MGTIRTPLPVKYICGVITREEETYTIALERLINRYGPVDVVSEVIPFTFTGYYEPEMGGNLLRRFVAFKNLMPMEILPDVKIFTNDLEEELGEMKNGELFRHINLDPGYVEMAKLILASTKNFRHRIYLRDGIFAEVTLWWSKGTFRHFEEYTFPDYRTEFYKDYFRKVREAYRLQLEES